MTKLDSNELPTPTAPVGWIGCPTLALAEVWASMDGKAVAFNSERGLDPMADDNDGIFEGYMADAVDMLERLAARGFLLVKS